MKLGFGVFGVLCAWTMAAHAGADKALLAPSFTASPKDLLSAASKVPAGNDGVVILRKENQKTYDARGRAVSRFRMVFVVTSQAGIDDWGTLTTTWQPFYQDKPVVRARVIEPSGKVTQLDASLIHDAPAVSASPTVFSDLRDLEVPLPRLQIGAVVEEEITTTDREPLLDAGTVDRFTYASSVPVLSAGLVVSAPVARKMIVVARSIAEKPKRTTANGIDTWTFELDKRAPLEDIEDYLPGDIVRYPFVGVATGASWSAIARDYLKILDRRLADGPFALPATLKGPQTLDTVHGIVAWLHAQIRYTGIEFGQASITPWPPAETVKRGFGDCKDKAILLVALLRQAGFRADLALLSTGPAEDVDATLPGLGEFDHAIVRAIVGGKPVWIDATEDLYRAGSLPLRDQGRRALIIANDTRDLVPTPRSTSADTLSREVRTFTLAEFGPARVVEVSRETGMFDASNRGWIRDTRADEVRDGLKEYATNQYMGELESWTSTPPADLAKPFELTTVVAKSSRAWSTREKIDVTLFLSSTLEKLPSDLKTFDAKAKPRVHDFELYRPHRSEVENRLVVPAGFTMPAPAAERKRTLGAASFVERQRVEGDTFVVTFVFDSGKARLKPAELAATRKAISELADERRHITIQQTAWALADAGKLGEAIKSVETLIAAHPKEALHHLQLARAYLKAGAGQAARRSVRKALELEPKSDDAYSMLAWVLQHDSLGRYGGFDQDRAGAIAAFRKAMELEPKEAYLPQGLAALLAVGPDGQWRGADLAGAIKAYEVALKLESDAGTALDLARVYLRAGKPADAERLLRPRDSSLVRDALLVSAIALQQGGAAAIAAASQLRTARTTLLDEAAKFLGMLRHYDLTRELYAATGSLTGPQAVLWKNVKRRPATLDRSDPRTAVREMFVDTLEPRPSTTVYWDETTRDQMLRDNTVPPQTRDGVRKLGEDLWPDLSHTVIDVQIDGLKGGPWAATFDAFGKKGTMYVALDRGVAKLIASQDAIEGLGRHAQRDTGNAPRLLDWARAAIDAGHTKHDRFTKVWGPGLPRDAKALAVAAAVLAGDKGSRPVLTACATTAPDAREHCDMILVSQLMAEEKWGELDKFAANSVPGALDKLWVRAMALVRLRKLDEADKLIADLVAQAPTHPMLGFLRIESLLGRGDPAKVQEHYEADLKLATPTKGAKNNYAWYLLAKGKDLARALEVARQAALENAERSNVINTLAAVSAEAGELQAGVKSGGDAMTIGGRKVPSGADWLVFATIYEKLGLRDDAIAAYKKVKPDEKSSSFGPTSVDIARARLVRMKAK